MALLDTAALYLWFMQAIILSLFFLFNGTDNVTKVIIKRKKNMTMGRKKWQSLSHKDKRSSFKLPVAMLSGQTPTFQLGNHDF